MKHTKKLLAISLLSIISFFLISQGCGTEDNFVYQQPKNNDFVINGQEGLHVDFPSIVALTYNEGKSEFCSGTLIKPDLVLTAAHCVAYMSVKNSHVVYGYENILDCDKADIISMHSKSMHPNYSQQSDNWYDVALILLHKDIPNANVAEILPITGFIPTLDPDSRVIIAGYGRHYTTGTPGTVLDVSQTSGVLYFGDVPVISRDNDFEIIVGEDQAGKPNVCYGDSGGPIYVTYNGKTYVTGVASRIPPGKPVECGHGGVYSLPGSHVQWIEEEYVKLQEKRDKEPSGAGGSGGADGAGGTPPLPSIPPPPYEHEEKEEPQVILSPNSCTYTINHAHNSSATLIALLFGLILLIRRKT